MTGIFEQEISYAEEFVILVAISRIAVPQRWREGVEYPKVSDPVFVNFIMYDEDEKVPEYIKEDIYCHVVEEGYYFYYLFSTEDRDRLLASPEGVYRISAYAKFIMDADPEDGSGYSEFHIKEMSKVDLVVSETKDYDSAIEAAGREG